MAKNKIAYAASAAALALSGVVIPTNVLADAADAESLCVNRTSATEEQQNWSVLLDTDSETDAYVCNDLTAAIGRINGKGGEHTIALKNDVNEVNSFSIAANTTFTLDLGGNTLKMGRKLAGSTGTTSQNWQLLKGANVTFKNGTIEASPNAANLVRNYTSLTLDNVTLDGSTMTERTDKENLMSLISAHGIVTVVDSHIIAPEEGWGLAVGWAEDVMNSIYIAGTQVEIDGDSTIDGDVLFAVWSEGVNPATSVSTLTIKNANVNGEFHAEEDALVANNRFVIEDGTFTVDPTAYLATGRVKYTANGNKYGVATANEFKVEQLKDLTLKAGEGKDLVAAGIVGLTAPADYAGGWDYSAEVNTPVYAYGSYVATQGQVEEDSTVTVTVAAENSVNYSNTVDVSIEAGLKYDSSDDNHVLVTFDEVIDGNVDLKIEKVEEIPEAVAAAEPDMKFIYDITLMDGDTVVPVEGKKMKVNFNFESQENYEYFQVAYIKDGAIVKYIDINEDSYGCHDGWCSVDFVTDHLSEYGLIASNTRIASAADKNDALNAPDSGAYTAEAAGNIDTTALVATVIVMTLAAGAMEVVAYKKRQARK